MLLGVVGVVVCAAAALSLINVVVCLDALFAIPFAEDAPVTQQQLQRGAPAVLASLNIKSRATTCHNSVTTFAPFTSTGRGSFNVK